jgi:hypothetical protein
MITGAEASVSAHCHEASQSPNFWAGAGYRDIEDDAVFGRCSGPDPTKPLDSPSFDDVKLPVEGSYLILPTR